MVRYSPKAALALAFLKSPYNDVDIFVEDKGNHNMWLLIVRRLLSNGKKISSVNLLGGRESVIAACKLDQGRSTRPRLYIIDGDMDFILDSPKPKLKHLHRVNAYCIENLLIREDSLVQIGLECKPTDTETTIFSQLDFVTTIEYLENILRPLFVIYAAARLLLPHERTVSLPLGELTTQVGKKPILDKTKVFHRINLLVRNIVSAVGLDSFRKVRKTLSKTISGLDGSKVISGKDYILPFILFHFRHTCGYKQGNEQFKVAMARSFSSSADPWLTRKLKAL